MKRLLLLLALTTAAQASNAGPAEPPRKIVIIDHGPTTHVPAIWVIIRRYLP